MTLHRFMNREEMPSVHESEIFSPLDTHFASFSAGLAKTGKREVFLAAALASAYQRKGHVCVDLSTLDAGKIFKNEQTAPVFPKLDEWRDRLWESDIAGKPGDFKPLILDEKSRLYLCRYWEYQKKLADSIRIRTGQETNLDLKRLGGGLNRLFDDPNTDKNDPNWQKIAAFAALRSHFCVISGGPGTGKTTTVGKILTLANEMAGSSVPEIALAAPTGKAASRLSEAIIRWKKSLAPGPGHVSEDALDNVPETASTLHRLLGAVPNSPYFRHNSDNPLPVDMLVVDEASMVDLALMSKLLQALPSHTRLILLGDRDQLASVEAGAALGDICAGDIHRFSKTFTESYESATGDAAGFEINDRESISDHIVQLRKSWRFGPDSGIAVVSRAVNSGALNDSMIKSLKKGPYADIRWRPLVLPGGLSKSFRKTIVDGYREYLNARDQTEIFGAFDKFRILCALREGPAGVVAVNRLVERVLMHERLISPERKWYAGRPVLIKRNNYNLRLFNGDVGIALPDPSAENDIRVFFPDGGGTRKFHPYRLPDHETVFAMTVHKSQGSEFDKVVLVLPDRDSPVITRELIYTGMTRARNHVEIWGNRDLLRRAALRRVERTSGLGDELWG